MVKTEQKNDELSLRNVSGISVATLRNDEASIYYPELRKKYFFCLNSKKNHHKLSGAVLNQPEV